GRSFERRDDRPSGGFRRDDRRDGAGDRGGFRRDDRPSGHRGSDRPFNRDRQAGDRPFNRDRQGDRPGFRSGGHDRPTGRRDDHRGSGTGTGSFGRRDDKPRWKRNG
ncbi:RNA helicase, partial [Streptomyces sp. NPDC096080]